MRGLGLHAQTEGSTPCFSAVTYCGSEHNEHARADTSSMRAMCPELSSLHRTCRWRA